jgi:hypothetical protein
MEIQSLKLFLTNADLCNLLLQNLPEQEGIEDLETRFTPQGVVVQARYYAGFGFRVPFETVWQVEPAASALRIQLTKLNVGGMPANLFQGTLLGMIRDAIANHPGLSMENDTLLVDIATLARSAGLELKICFTEVRLSIGTAVIEAG